MNTISIVGGGLYTIKLIQNLASMCPSDSLNIKLIARRFPRLQKIASYAAKSISGQKKNWTIEACSNQQEALEGSVEEQD